jgi:Uma2 family endonuclease
MSGKDESMTPAGSGVKLTYDDYLLFPDDGQRHELIDGEHYVTPTPLLRHQRILGNLYFAIRAYLELHPVGEVFMAPLDVILSKYDVVDPDLLYVSKGRGKEIYGEWIHGAPDLVVEIASPTTRKRDETIKRRLYERWNVLEYWTIDPELEIVRVYRRREGGFERAVELSHEAGDVLTTPLLSGLEVTLAAIFKE